jgi:hypothetical protein
MANSISHASLPYPIAHARFSVLVPFLDATGVPTDPTTPDTEFSLDAAAFADCAEEVATITGSNGLGHITLTGAETNGSALGLAFKVASGPKPTLMTLYPRNLPILSTGTLAAGSAGGGTLQTPLAYDVTGCFLRTTGGTGGGGTGGMNNQARRIATYTPSTGAFTVTPNWEVTPSTDTTYDLLCPEGVTVGMVKVQADVVRSLGATIQPYDYSVASATDGVESGITPRMVLRGQVAVLAGLNTGAGTGTEVFKAAGNPGTTRTTYVIDSNGNRTTVTLNW